MNLIQTTKNLKTFFQLAFLTFLHPRPNAFMTTVSVEKKSKGDKEQLERGETRKKRDEVVSLNRFSRKSVSHPLAGIKFWRNIAMNLASRESLVRITFMIYERRQARPITKRTPSRCCLKCRHVSYTRPQRSAVSGMMAPERLCKDSRRPQFTDSSRAYFRGIRLCGRTFLRLGSDAAGSASLSEGSLRGPSGVVTR